jgi:hypothetical protein
LPLKSFSDPNQYVGAEELTSWFGTNSTAIRSDSENNVYIYATSITGNSPLLPNGDPKGGYDLYIGKYKPDGTV